MMPLWRRRGLRFHLGDDQRHVRSIRNAELSSITRVPLAATCGAYSRASSVETEKSAISRPRQASTVNSWTGSDSPANVHPRPN